MGKIKPINQEDELSMVEHLDELRTRLIFTGSALIVVAAICFWQNHEILRIVNAPLPAGKEPATFGVSEAFMSTITVTMYAALIILMPLIVYQLYAFVVPAFSDKEKHIARPMVVLAPVLFLLGTVFGYFVVLPAAVNFLLNFNDDQFNILVRAKDYYSFFGMTVLSMGLLFEMPMVILVASRLGFVSPEFLRKNRRYAILINAVVAMALPGTDPVSMLIEMVPLLFLYEISIWLVVWFGGVKPVPGSVETTQVSSDDVEPGSAMR